MINHRHLPGSLSPTIQFLSIIIGVFLLALFCELLLAQNTPLYSTNDSLKNNVTEDSLSTKDSSKVENHHQKSLWIKIPLFIPCALIVTVVSTALGPIILPIEIYAWYHTSSTPGMKVYYPFISKYILLWQFLS